MTGNSWLKDPLPISHPLDGKSGRGERIRTSDLSVPNRAHYQAVLRPVSLSTAIGRAILASASSQGQGTKEISSALKRSSSMTYRVFHFRAQLGESFIEPFGNENRIIAEPILAARC